MQSATRAPANSVDSREFRTNAVGSSEIRAGAVGASELRTDSVRVSEIRASAVRSAEVATNAIGAEEIAPNAVAESEVATGAIGTDELRDGQVDLADLSPATRTALVGTGAVTYRAAVTPAGANAGGTASFVARTAAAHNTVTFPSAVGACQYAATLAAVKSGDTLVQPPAGRVTVAPAGQSAGRTARTVCVDGTAGGAPFPLAVA